ncbi:MAG: hypothetical protein ACFFF4_11040 [Candidatus Thorarchaeota archaeon]
MVQVVSLESQNERYIRRSRCYPQSYGYYSFSFVDVAAIEVTLSRWVEKKFKRGVWIYNGQPPAGDELWERIYWSYEQKPRIWGTMLQLPNAVWLIILFLILIPPELLFHSSGIILLGILFLACGFFSSIWSRRYDRYKQIYTEVEYKKLKQEME